MIPYRGMLVSRNATARRSRSLAPARTVAPVAASSA
jgi:hypothetical protein